MATRLWPNTQSMRLPAHRDTVREPPRARVEHVHFIVVAARNPQLAPVRAHVPHVGTAPAGHGPRCHDASRPRIEHGDRAGAAASAGRRVPAAVRHIHEAAVATRVDPMRAPPRWDETDAPE